jgi:FkbM family methyltransferase
MNRFVVRCRKGLKTKDLLKNLFMTGLSELLKVRSPKDFTTFIDKVSKAFITKAFGMFGFTLVHKASKKGISPPIDNYLWLEDYDIKTVLDIGANLGGFVSVILECLPDSEVYAFEPLNDEYHRLVKDLEEVNNLHLFKIALGDYNGAAEIHKTHSSVDSGCSELSSLRQMSGKARTTYQVEKISDETVNVRRLDDLLLDENIELEPDILIKLDVQGFEDKVIAGGEVTFKKARIVIIEISFNELYKGQQLFDGLYSRLKALGFTYKGNVSGQGLLKKKGLEVEIDAVFVRE